MDIVLSTTPSRRAGNADCRPRSWSRNNRCVWHESKCVNREGYSQPPCSTASAKGSTGSEETGSAQRHLIL